MHEERKNICHWQNGSVLINGLKTVPSPRLVHLPGFQTMRSTSVVPTPPSRVTLKLKLL
jgi:hypothetical protein